jgi:hypothetical protein
LKKAADIHAVLADLNKTIILLLDMRDHRAFYVDGVDTDGNPRVTPHI